MVYNLIGDDTIPVEIKSISKWTVNHMHAVEYSKGRVYCMGDATHRHPPSNGLGSNTSIQDAYNLAWKLALVIKGQADAALLDSYQEERAPIGKQIVDRANKSIEEFGPIFQALGLLDTKDPEKMISNMADRKKDGPKAEKQREALRQAIAHKVYEFDAHGVEMNQRYVSSAVVPDGSKAPGFSNDPELVYEATTYPGARLPHVWVEKDRQKALDARPLRQGRLHADHVDRRRWLDRGGGRHHGKNRPADPHRQDRTRLRGRGPLRRLGARPRGRRHGLHPRAPRPSCRLAGQKAFVGRAGRTGRRVFGLLGKPAKAAKKQTA